MVGTILDIDTYVNQISYMVAIFFFSKKVDSSEIVFYIVHILVWLEYGIFM